MEQCPEKFIGNSPFTLPLLGEGIRELKIKQRRRRK
jgi:hypothetical protein